LKNGRRKTMNNHPERDTTVTLKKGKRTKAIMKTSKHEAWNPDVDMKARTGVISGRAWISAFTFENMSLSWVKDTLMVFLFEHETLNKGGLKMKIIKYIVFLFAILWVVPVKAEIPTVLTDKIRNGDGIIDIFKDATSTELQSYLEGGTLFLGVDINEDASGNESSTSSGVAIKQAELLITTTEGDFSFSEYYTNTTALISETGSTEAQEFNTLFGNSGSNQLTGSTSNFDISTFDDVLEIRNVNVTGDILAAELRVTFLDTAQTGDNETFFDYSAGFEEFAILTTSDAKTLDSADIGLGDAPQNIAYNVSAPSGTPEPQWYLLMALPAVFFWRKYGRGKAHT
jgi:hypothetical protein